LNEQSLSIEYKSFKAQDSKQQIYYPYLLKEYRNRWFLIAKLKTGRVLSTMALDRILSFQVQPNEPFEPYKGVDFERYFSDLLGVTKTERDRAYKVIIQVDKAQAPYVITKPLHASQVVEQEMEDGGIIIRIDVVINYELEREILGFGDGMKVHEPRILSKRIEDRLKKAAQRYALLPS
jgi:predicted DNA-binding transcriptional regulator YafY